MALLLVEGFEQISPDVEITATQMQTLFLGTLPDVTDDWFSDTGDSVVHSTGGRIANNCLEFRRGDEVAGAWSAKYAANLGFSFSPKQTVSLGYAVKYSIAPTDSIPLCLFRYDNGSTELEQLGLWATSDGKIYVSTADYISEFINQENPLINPLATTPTATIRLTDWSYIEVLLDYSDDVPKLTVLVNGQIVLDGITDATLQKMLDEPYISSVHIINPTTSPFGLEAMTQSIDDMYLAEGTIYGPQQIIPLENSGTFVTQGTWNTTPPSEYKEAGGSPDTPATASSTYSSQTFELADLPTDSGVVNGVGVTVIALVPAGIDGLDFGIIASTGSPKSKHIAISDDFDRAYRYVTSTLPSALSTNEAGVNAMRGYLLSNSVVV